MMPNAPMSSVDEAKLFLQNKQLFAHMQANPALAFGPGGPKPAPQQFAQQPVQAFPKPQAPALNTAMFADRTAANQFMRMPDVLGLGGQNYAAPQQPQQRAGGIPQNGINPVALMQTMMAQQQQQAAVAAAQQGAVNAFGQQQQVRAAVASLLQQQQQAAALQQQQQQIAALQQQQQQIAAMQQQRAAQQQAQAAFPSMAQQQVNAQAQQAQNNAWFNAAIQRTLANSQMQAGKGPAVLGGMQQQQHQAANPNQAAAQMIQQLQAAAATAAAQQKHAQQVQIVKQIQAVLAQQAKVGANQQQQAVAQAQQQQQQQSMAALKQAQLQEALAAVNSRAVNGGAKLNALNLPAGAQGQTHSHAQVHQAQVQQRIRHNMAALANLTPAQLQTLGANPALAQALLQARTAANAAQVPNGGQPPQQQQHGQQQQAHGQQQQQDMQSTPLNIPGAEALLSSLRTHDPRFKQQAPASNSHVSSSSNHSPTSSVAGSVNGDSASGSPPNAMNKEQRRMALACVALQLAHSGISVDQAIHSGIMGGMSVADVRFIVEVYNAEQTRMKQEGLQPGTGIVLPNGAANGKGSVNGGNSTNGAASPNGSVHNANGNNGPMQQQHADGGNVAAAVAAANASAMARLQQQQLQGQLPVQRSMTNSPGASSRAGSDAGRSHASANAGHGSSNNNMAGGPAMDSLSADHTTTFTEGGPDAFNALSYGFFGTSNVPGELLGELESGLEGDMGLEIDEMQAWMPDGAEELSCIWGDGPTLSEGLEGESDADLLKGDDVASRLANLDLGSGFF